MTPPVVRLSDHARGSKIADQPIRRSARRIIHVSAVGIAAVPPRRKNHLISQRESSDDQSEKKDDDGFAHISLLVMAYRRGVTARSSTPATHYSLPTTHYSLPTTHYLLPATH